MSASHSEMKRVRNSQRAPKHRQKEEAVGHATTSKDTAEHPVSQSPVSPLYLGKPAYPEVPKCPEYPVSPVSEGQAQRHKALKMSAVHNACTAPDSERKRLWRLCVTCGR
jgi:hypothetical protein